MFFSAWVPEEVVTAGAVMQQRKQVDPCKQTFDTFVGLILLKDRDNQRLEFKKEKR